MHILESFRGLLFLSSGWWATIDFTLSSRMTVALQFEALNDEKRAKIWRRLFDRLEDDSELSDDHKVTVDRRAQEYVLNDPAVKELAWNGREIKHAPRTATSLASHKAFKAGASPDSVVKIEEEHSKSVVRMSRAAEQGS